jgi:hypothetical protein
VISFMQGAVSGERAGLSFVAVIVTSMTFIFIILLVGILHSLISRVRFLVDTHYLELCT